jgi:hypothetical protein
MLESLHVMQNKYGAISGRQTLYATLQIDAVKRSFQNCIETPKIHRWWTTAFVGIERLVKGHGRK